ncbi:hypothetical protein F2P81_021768 [Scophthalmus maximus]|uniref:Uncharacterized protein n=1 Tax=Scophthalmus maximus TaxID=52904 RepID=A0A6A4RWR7_SCOMX|nr:hypothetical protein F2P81_021768 [Scophthalmus maximus]
MMQTRTRAKSLRKFNEADSTITDYKPLPQTCDSNPSLLNDLNSFFARFEAHKRMPTQKTNSPPHDQALCLTAASVKTILSKINTQKAAGPENIPGRVLKDCAVELKDVGHLQGFFCIPSRNHIVKKNNLFLNIDKTKEVVIHFRRGHTPKPPLTINGAAFERSHGLSLCG